MNTYLHRLGILCFIFVAVFVLVSCAEIHLDKDKDTRPSTKIMAESSKDISHVVSGSSTGKNVLDIVNTRLHSDMETNELIVDTDNTVIYAGRAFLHLEFDNPVDITISEFIYIDGEKINPDYIKVENNTVRIYLSNDLPEKYSLTLTKNYNVNDLKMSDDYCLNFVHYPPLSCIISVYDKDTQKTLPAAIYLTETNPSFSFEFNKPVKKDSLSFITEMGYMDYVVEWLSECEFVLFLNNLDSGRHKISINDIQGIQNIFGNKIMKGYDYFNSCAHEFEVLKSPLNIYSISPETGEISVLHSLKYGAVFESISPDSKYLSLGIVLDNTEGHHYTKTIFNIENKKLDFLYPTIQKSRFQLYNPLIENSYWDNNNMYQYIYDRCIYKMNPENNDIVLTYKLQNNTSWINQLFNLKNGDMAVIISESDYRSPLSLIHINEEGKQLGEYKLPFKTKTGEGWFLYISNVADAGNGSLLVSGYEFTAGEENLLSTYTLDLSDGSLKLISKGETLIGHFPDIGFSMYRKYSSILRKSEIEIISMEGHLLHRITHSEDIEYSDIVYNPIKNVFYMLSFSYEENRYSIMSLDPVTFEITPTTVSFKTCTELIGVLPDGNLLAMDVCPGP